MGNHCNHRPVNGIRLACSFLTTKKGKIDGLNYRGPDYNINVSDKWPQPHLFICRRCGMVYADPIPTGMEEEPLVKMFEDIHDVSDD